MDLINIIGTLFDNSIEHVVALAHQIKDLRLGKNQQEINEDIYNQIQIAKETKEKAKGYFDTYSSLIQNVGNPEIGDWAIVKNDTNGKWYIYKCIVKGYWTETQEEYSTDINLNEYAKKAQLKTINDQSLVGEGNIEITGEHYEVASQNNDGLLSKEFYTQLLTMRNETLPAIQEHIDNILLLFDDEQTPENIQALIDRYNQICEFIASLGDSDNGQILQQIIADIDALQDDIDNIESDISENVKADLAIVKDDISNIQEAVRKLNDDLEESNANIAEGFISVYNKINEIEGGISQDIDPIKDRLSVVEQGLNTEKTRAQREENSLAQRITQLEQNPVTPEHMAGHIFLTQSEYDALTTYERDTLYIIVEQKSSEGSSSSFGDTFPLIFG